MAVILQLMTTLPLNVISYPTVILIKLQIIKVECKTLEIIKTIITTKVLTKWNSQD